MRHRKWKTQKKNNDSKNKHIYSEKRVYEQLTAVMHEIQKKILKRHAEFYNKDKKYAYYF